MKNPLLISLLALSLCLAACDFNGGVEQGRCVAYDPDKNTITMVVDTTLDQHDPHYSGKVDTWKLPENPLDMGPAPVAGGLLMLELDKNMVLYYDRETKSIREMPVESFSVEKNINEKHPKLKGKSFPIINREDRTVTVYSPRLESIVVIKVPEAELNLPVYVWELGDEVRIAFRKDMPGQAIRFMNVSKTSIFTR